MELRRTLSLGAKTLAVACFAAALTLLVAGHWQPAYCQTDSWWQELWVVAAPVLILLGGALSFARPEHRPTLLMGLFAVVLLGYWFAKFASLAGVCAN